MKKLLIILTSALLAVIFAATLSAENPTVKTSFTPDPAPMVYDGVLYLYTGEDSVEDNGFYNMTSWRCYSTTDMVNWVDHGEILRPEDFEWADAGSAWACQCIERNGKFYLYVTVTNGGGRNIGVAVSDSPTGPFKDAIGGPLCGPNWLYIDPTVMIDDDGQAYLYFGNPNAYYCKLNEDMISLDGEIKQQDMTREAFGSKPFESDAPSSYTEGPWIYKRDGMYYLVYASNGVPEGISYSTSDSPEGPWKYRGIIMEPGDSTTIHPGIIDYKDHSYFFYHGVLLERGGWNKRSTAIVEFEYNDDGTIPLMKHSEEGPAQIENFDPFNSHQAETMSDCSPEIRSVTSKKRVYLSDITDGSWIKLSGVDFKDGAKSFSAEILGSGTLELRLDSEKGKKIGEITFDAKNFDTVSCALSGAKGVHDLYFVFKDGDFRFDTWQMSEEDLGYASSTGTGISIWAIVGIAAAVLILPAIVFCAVAAKKRNK